jgi:hypothetical protein
MERRESRLGQCFNFLERTRDAEEAKTRFPDLTAEIDDFVLLNRVLSKLAPEGLDEERLLQRKQAFLGTTTKKKPRQPSRAPSLRLASLFAAGGLFVAASIGASAAGLPVPAAELLNTVGISRGQNVSSSVQDAIASNSSVSEAACAAAHDRSTLPVGAQAAPGREGKETKDCSQLATESEPNGVQRGIPSGVERGQPEIAGTPVGPLKEQRGKPEVTPLSPTSPDGVKPQGLPGR